MITRRKFIKTLAVLPAAQSLAAVGANSPSPGRVALVIGNATYRDAPLVNPVNDARSMGALLAQAGFATETVFNARRQDMAAAMERFNQATRRSETQLAVFYYAGHGAQMEWRNYLVPVDAAVRSPAQLKEASVDFTGIFGGPGLGTGRSAIFILDACRNDPFGSAFRPEQRGLSQFDAPAGSLIAYATAPGNVAYDGDIGGNGLYTSRLLRELGRPSVRIEDALKRVRLGVRLASNGEQIPWETTSLEGDVMLFGAEKLSEAELERRIEADIATWSRIKASAETRDWIAYLEEFPNGRFSEIAQMRLGRLLAAREMAARESAPLELAMAKPQAPVKSIPQAPDPQPRLPQPEPAAAPAKTEVIAKAAVDMAMPKAPAAILPVVKTTPAVEVRPHATPSELAAASPDTKGVAKAVGDTAATKSPAPVKPLPQAPDIPPGVPLPTLSAAPANPYSAGRYPLARVYTVGDKFVIRQSDLFTGLDEGSRTLRVTLVDADADRVEFNEGSVVTDLMGNVIRNPDVEFDTPIQFTPAEFQIGKKWTAVFNRRQNGVTARVNYDVRIEKQETITVPAGTFRCFLIEARGWNLTRNVALETRMWLVPELNYYIRREVRNVNGRGITVASERHELVSFHQKVIRSAI